MPREIAPDIPLIRLDILAVELVLSLGLFADNARGRVGIEAVHAEFEQIAARAHV